MEKFVAAGLHSTTHEKNTLRLELAFVTVPRCTITLLTASFCRDRINHRLGYSDPSTVSFSGGTAVRSPAIASSAAQPFGNTTNQGQKLLLFLAFLAQRAAGITAMSRCRLSVRTRPAKTPLLRPE
jgi:hypothetical protein